MIEWNTGVVCGQLALRGELQWLEVKMDHNGTIAKAVHDLTISRMLRIGDRVKLNATAVNRKLGSGGYHFVYALTERLGQTGERESECDGEPNFENSTEHASEYAAECAPELAFEQASEHANELDSEKAPISEELRTKDSRLSSAGTIMKLRYTPLQRAVKAAEEEGSPHHDLFLRPNTLEGVPVMVGELHSMLPAWICWLRHKQQLKSGRIQLPRIAYVMSDGAALPIAWSEHVHRLKKLGWLAGTVTYGHAYGGDVETVNKYTALLAARHILHADVIVAIMGPGIAGTGTALGHTGVEVGELVNAVSSLQGKPTVIPRISFADGRERHRGLSHHVLTALSTVAVRQAVLTLPASLPEQQSKMIRKQLETNSPLIHLHKVEWIEGIRSAELTASHRLYGAPITTMGRTVHEDAAFFAGVAAAAQHYWLEWTRRRFSPENEQA